ncbi:DNA-binding SARP family transcriptional activator/Flp pilus assembly protein TadD [Streptosporangium album]|uniref:DNA-binding SARP family transcriptional activator/Flp pilus assembly protein TadD n=1 Tax=Streptosporangium album TaxID=47479 RepID=A0A7W7S5T7_9ACTN|nr:BTAD domain-containing putative transcriptional regulator [Streptosporangium album]MBB4944435.1 DNA-binding SARP family transcriptional activator/Flp pilus assembly protein TadD [Streptosporangium album]
MDFRVLGPLEITVDGQRLDLGGIRQQTVLAVLLLDPNRAITIGRLMEAIYGDDPPTTSRAQVQICISALRRLFAAHGNADLISTQSQGYEIQVDNGQIDSNRFETLVTQARRARENRSPGEAIRHYREALSLWRGPALEGIESRLVQSAAGRLTERRITANEDCIQLELDLGRHHELVGELTELVEEHPLRERLRGQLMTALYRSGRQAEALQVYRLARRTMVEELGIEPNERLQQLEHAILTSDESLDLPEQPVQIVEEPAARVPSVPGMLPTDIADFTGRTKQIDDIRQRLTLAAGDRSGFAVPIIAIVGKAGIGKTSIAVHAAHSVAKHFPDGQLYADLHGGVLRPTSPMQVLERFLRVLGVPGTALPDGLEERAEMYRALLADRKMLIVLDDVGNESQVLPLLPGNPASAVIITSRSRLAGLAGAIHIDVDVFDSSQSMDLLSRIAGAERVQSEAGSAAALAELCGRLPLALRIAGARLLARPHWSIDQLVGRLEDETRRLDELRHGDMGIRASISLTYDSAGEDARRLFRRLAILDSQLFPAWISAALLDMPFADAQDLLDDLADAQLVETTEVGRGVHTQYRFHDLIRVFARERLAAEESATERSAALARALGGLLFLAEAARRREYGPETLLSTEAALWSLPGELVDRLIEVPLTWFERERLILVSGIRQAAQAGFVELCWGLTINVVAFFEARVYLDDWRETHEIALAAGRQAQDKRGQAAVLHSMGSLAITEQRFEDARREFDLALRLFREVDDARGIALTVRNIGFLERLSGHFEEAAAHYEWALKIFRDVGDNAAAAYTLHNLAQLRLELDDFDGAKHLLSEALRLSESGGSRRVRAQVLSRMGHTHLQAEEPALAAQAFEEALEVVRDIGDSTGEAYTLHGLGVARLRQGKLAEADAALRHSLMLASTSNQRLAEARVLVGLGELALSNADPAQAVTQFQHALALFQRIRVPVHEARTLILLNTAYLAGGDNDAAHDALVQALALTDEIGPPVAGQMRKRLTEKLRDSES